MTITITPITPPTAQTITFATVRSPIGIIEFSAGIRVIINRIATPTIALIRSFNPFFRIKNKIIQIITAIITRIIAAIGSDVIALRKSVIYLIYFDAIIYKKQSTIHN